MNPGSIRPSVALLPFTLCLVLASAATAGEFHVFPPGWKPVQRDLCLDQYPAASEHEVRLIEHLSTSVYFDSDIDFERTTLTDPRHRARLSPRHARHITLRLETGLEPAERLPLEVVLKNGTRVHLTLVPTVQETDLHLFVYQRPKPTLEELKAEHSRLLARYAVRLSESNHLRSRARCTQVEEPEEARAAPADSGRTVVIQCQFPEAPKQELNRWPFLEEREPAGRFTVNGDEDGGIAQGLMGKALLYRHPEHSVVVISMISLEPEQPWSLGEYTVRKEATGEPVKILAVESSQPSLDFGDVGFVAFVIDTPRDGQERYVLEVHEKEGPRRIRAEGLTFGAREPLESP